MRTTQLILTLLIISTQVYANYPASIVKVVDGDTIRMWVDVWPNMFVDTKVRLSGIDAPEITWRAACDEERKKGFTVKFYVEELLASATKIEIANVKNGKYAGRVVADVLVYREDSVINLSEHLLERGLVIKYGHRKRFCPP